MDGYNIYAGNSGAAKLPEDENFDQGNFGENEKEGRVSLEMERKMGKNVLAAAEGFASTAERYRKVPEFTAENTRDYVADRRRMNLEYLQRKSPHLAAVYRDVVEMDKDLGIIAVVDEDIQNNAYFSAYNMSGGKYRSEVRFNFRRPETYTEPSMEFLLKKIAMKVGAWEKDVLKNQKLVSTFVFVHELGHGSDFVNNYLKEEWGKNPGHEALRVAVLKKQKQQLRDGMTMPIPEHINGTMAEKLSRLKPRLKAMGIRSNRQLMVAEQRAYREKSMERIADNFATDYIMKHFDDYFLRAGERDDGSGRIVTGELVEMGEDFAEVLGMKEGMFLGLTDKAGRKREGYLMENAAIGESIVLNPGGDPEEQGGLIRTSRVERVFRRKWSDGKMAVTLKTEGGAVFGVYSDGSKLPRKVEMKAEKLNEALGIGAGSEVQLMKVRLEADEDSNVQEGAIMHGKIRAPIRMREGILFDNGARISNVVGIYRQWRTWYVETISGSTYEVLPL